MHKKGFSLVELSVVIVLIGIIIGMAIKGQEMLRVARVNAEVAKINKFSSAVNSFYTTNNRMPNLDNANKVDIDTEFIEKGFLSESDIKNDINEKGAQWMFYACELSGNDKAYYDTPSNLADDNWNLCVLSNTTGNELNAILVCNIETALDDISAVTGRGRGWKSTLSLNEGFFKNCNAYKNSTDTMAYSYRIF